MNKYRTLPAMALIAIVLAALIYVHANVSAKKDSPLPARETAPAIEPPQFSLPTTTRFRVINMVPNAQSNETNQDSEPNLAVDPQDVTHMIGSAFTPNPSGSLTSAPIYASTNSGTTWTLRNIVPSGNGMTGDISLKFGLRGHTLFTGILLGGSGLTMNILRSADPFAGGTMTQLVSRGNVDQPYVNALTLLVSGSDRDRVFIGDNDLGAANGRTATIDHSANARTAAAPAGFSNTVVETRTTNGQDRPSVRAAANADGRVYGLFARTTASSGQNRTCDVTVVRDDNFGIGANPFRALTGGDGGNGILVATGVNMPFINSPALGQQRLGSHMSIAVDPTNSQNVFIAWTDRPGATGTALHVRRSTTSGSAWSADQLTITNGVNPALAINSAGVVGVLYQQLVSGRWETHLRRRTITGTTWSDVILSNTPDNTPPPAFQPYLGDYCDLMSVGKNFYGVFSASNVPILANFPQGVTYQRNANFSTNQLRNVSNTSNVSTSIDPYFFAAEQVPIIFDTCLINPLTCPIVTFDPSLVKVKCLREPCIVVDPIPRNCLVKFDCPGCGGDNVLCPPYYHMYFDNIDPEQWQVVLVHKRERVPFELNRTEKGIVVSFRPTEDKFKEKTIGDYTLVFFAEKLNGKREYEFPSRLEVSDYRYSEHIKYGRK